MILPDGYLDVLARIESGNRPYVKAPTSSASGLFQFTRATWCALGGSWGPDPAKAFGGLKPSVQEQVERAAAFTQANAAGLAKAGLAVTRSTLYAAHFFGLVTAVKVLKGAASAQVAPLAGAAVMKANHFLDGMTAGDFRSWLDRKTAWEDRRQA